jgi:hypothetical protein
MSVSLTSTGPGEIIDLYGTYPASTAQDTYFIVWNNNGTLDVIGEFIVTTQGILRLISKQWHLEPRIRQLYPDQHPERF